MGLSACSCGDLEVGDVSRSLPFPLTSGLLLGGAEGRRRDFESGTEGGRRAPDEIRRMGDEL